MFIKLLPFSIPTVEYKAALSSISSEIGHIYPSVVLALRKVAAFMQLFSAFAVLILFAVSDDLISVYFAPTPTGLRSA